MHYDESGNVLLLGRDSPPLTQVFAQIGVHVGIGGDAGSLFPASGAGPPAFGPRRDVGLALLCLWRIGWSRKPIHPATTDIAGTACLPLGNFTEVHANPAMPARPRFGELPNFAIPLPAALFLHRIANLLHEMG